MDTIYHHGSRSFRKTMVAAFSLALTVCLVSGCATRPAVPCDPKLCMETLPQRVDGLQVVRGPRNLLSIIRDMVPVVCNGHALFRHMQPAEPDLTAGTVILKVMVEYTGEVNRVTVEETTLTSKRFFRELTDFAMDADFLGWATDDADTVFLYPMAFGPKACRE